MKIKFNPKSLLNILYNNKDFLLKVVEMGLVYGISRKLINIKANFDIPFFANNSIEEKMIAIYRTAKDMDFDSHKVNLAKKNL